ncbi:COMM domain containing protein 9 [Dissostichus eleginoides]|uniref:COMM domain containing protein 9 n=1 Tax=Dissostichus eleginoides TaxID=100907 RepID=A0AAD9BS10_DISEL|nr:COMM domain containing protein 9 [Dissostichus eleginoides]
MAASVSSEHFDSLQLLLKAPSKDALVHSLHVLSHHVLFLGLSSPEQILSLFPDSFHSIQHGDQKPSVIRLKDLDWTVSMVTGSDSLSRMSVPTCLVQLQDPCQAVSTTTVELSRASLDTMLDGLGRIRDQLSVVAGK